jgi:hypothetical protein
MTTQQRSQCSCAQPRHHHKEGFSLVPSTSGIVGALLVFFARAWLVSLPESQRTHPAGYGLGDVQYAWKRLERFCAVLSTIDICAAPVDERYLGWSDCWRTLSVAETRT